MYSSPVADLEAPPPKKKKKKKKKLIDYIFKNLIMY